MEAKSCPGCRAVKPIREFGRNRALPDGTSFYCLTCNRERNNRWYRDRRRSLGKDVRDHSWVPDDFRWCPSCEQAVPVEAYVHSVRTSSRYGSRCKPCHNKANNEAYWLRTYGISKADVEAIRGAQDNRCAMCGDPGPQHLDHCHSSGRMRALPCQGCNHGLGQFRDDPGLLHVAPFCVEHHCGRQALERLEKAADVRPEGPSRPGEPPVGSQRRRGGGRGTRSTGRSSGERRQGAAGEAGA